MQKRNMSCLGRVTSFIWGYDAQYYNRVGYHAPFISFAVMQIIRLVQLILVFCVWCVTFYINVKRSIIYMNCWALTITFLALFCLFFSSGKQYILRTNERQLQKSKRMNFSLWRYGVAFYAIALPFSAATMVWFLALVSNDQLCQTYNDFGYN